MLLLVFEFLGTTELLVIALVALIIFGPRKLPEIGRKIGRGMAEFKRASEDFKRTWEYEVEVERRQPSDAEPEAGSARGALPAGEAELTTDIADWTPDAPGAATPAAPEAETIARGTAHDDAPPRPDGGESVVVAPERERESV
jgi:TatA/E family protein of Tat protein translocase